MAQGGYGSGSYAKSLQGPRRRINMLLIGRTGVGKSRFINSFANYARYQSIQEIHEVECPIPCVFYISDENKESVQFEVGDFDAATHKERLGDGLSSQTAECRSYNFNFDDIAITLIDTPGMADTGGVDEDKKNLKQTFEYLSGYKEIQAICILLKPNESRDDCFLRYCFLELLNQFEISGAKNLVFAFTHSRPTRFGPGTSDPIIRKIINDVIHDERSQVDEIPYNKHNRFYFDSEAFEYIVAKDTIKFKPHEAAFYEGSWEESKAECLRMVQYVTSLLPHDMSNSYSVYRARQIVENLIPLLIDFSKVMTNNEEKLLTTANEIDGFKGPLEELRKLAYSTIQKVKTTHYDEPRIICKSSSCATEVMQYGQRRNAFTKICYTAQMPLKEMFINGARQAMEQAREVYNELPREVQEAAAILAGGGMALGGEALAMAIGGLTIGGAVIGGVAAASWYVLKCKDCGCPNFLHSFTYYETEVVSEEVIVDVDKGEEYKQKLSVEEEKRRMLAFYQSKLSTLRKGREVIDGALSTFAVFLKYRSIVAYNDAYEDYLDFSLKVEMTSQGHVDYNKVERLKQHKEDYRKKKQLLDDIDVNYGYGGPHWREINLSTIEQLVGRLGELEEYGPDICRVTEAEKRTEGVVREKKKRWNQSMQIAVQGKTFFSFFK